MRNTSYEAQKRWETNSKRVRITAELKKDLVAEFKAKCDANGDSYNSVLIKGIEAYLED